MTSNTLKNKQKIGLTTVPPSVLVGMENGMGKVKCRLVENQKIL